MPDNALYSPSIGPSGGSVTEFPAKVTGPANLSSILGRIEEAIEAETEALRGNTPFDLKASNARKSRYLYELNKAIKGVPRHELLARHRDAILRLREKLVRNEATVRAHRSAVSEIANLIKSVIQRAEADGTYSATEFGRSPAA